MEFVIIIISIMIYMMPWWISKQRGHLSSASIFLVNLCLGWTLLIWFGCLVWALNGNTENNMRMRNGRW